ncbi:DUF1534 domain-containing protein [Pseudomonas syringae]|nr:DUF1534 domain-containing protein [Pseudomonas syringae]MCF5740880.1 DUF1534 domain-containing protein [Pseudomonas syringae]MCF5753519.1 DUF1534 domain-containing protein [Pseudomonas syringae]
MRLSFRTLQRGNAVLDALRRKMALTWWVSLQTGCWSPDPLRPPASRGRPCWCIFPCSAGPVWRWPFWHGP